MAGDVTGWMLAALICLAGLTLCSKPLQLLAKFFVRCLVGMASIFVLDFLLSPTGVCVGINLFTACISGALGIPGVALLYGLACYFFVA